MKRWTFFGVGAMMVSMAALISGCDNSDMPASEDENLSAESRSVISLSDAELSIVPAVNDFGVSMFAAYLGRGYDSANNVSFAPVSMAMCLGMLANGKDDEAREDLFDVIGVDRSRIGDFNSLMKKLVDGLPDSDSKNKLMMANGIWVGIDIDLQPSYPGFVDEYYKSPVTKADLSAASTATAIDGWAAAGTDGMIERIFRYEPGMNVFLASAQMFEGEWSVPFDKNKTSKGSFENIDGTKSSVDMMHGQMRISHSTIADAEVVGLPYYLGTYQAVFVVPRNGVSPTDYLQEILSVGLERYLKVELNETVNLSLPKLDIPSTPHDFSGVLSAFGLDGLFDGDYPGISSSPININQVLQYSALKMDEKGTKSASVTVATLFSGTDNSNVTPVDVAVNRPFILFVTNYDTGAIVTMSVVEKM